MDDLFVSLQISRKSRSGFTIVEIMLVLALISILAAFLLPMFMHGREMSYKVVCANNLRQFSVAFNLYSQDWSGFWPCPGGLAGDRSYWAQTGNGGLQSYVKQRGIKSIWCCPCLTEWRSKYPARTYSMNSYLRTPCDVEYYSCVNFLCGIKVGRINEPRRTILLYEGLQLTVGWEGTPLYEYIYRCANWQYVRGYVDKVAYASQPGKPAHGRFNNYLYCDGHIVSRPPGRCSVSELSSYSEMREWYVDKTYYETIYQEKWSYRVPRN